MPLIKLDTTTALVVIDLQKGIIGRELAPYTGAQVASTVQELAKRFRRAGAPVVLVNVKFSKDLKDALRQEVDAPTAMPPGGYPENFSELIDGLALPGDILITKRQWSAFYGTELDLQLRMTWYQNNRFDGYRYKHWSGVYGSAGMGARLFSCHRRRCYIGIFHRNA